MAPSTSFCFRLAERDIARLKRLLAKKFRAKPTRATSSIYHRLPSSDHIYHEERDDQFVVKFVGTTSFWVPDEEESREEADRQVLVRTRKESRVVHLLRIYKSRLLEIRINHASYDAPADQWEKDFHKFLNKVGPIVRLEDLTAIPIWRGFRRQILDRERTYMTVDEAVDSVTKQRISLRREHGADLRDNDDYNLG